MTTEPKPRRTYTPAERIARLRSQEEMILKRALEKKRERVGEALSLLGDIDDKRVLEAATQLVAWLEETKK